MSMHAAAADRTLARTARLCDKYRPVVTNCGQDGESSLSALFRGDTLAIGRPTALRDVTSVPLLSIIIQAL